MGDLIERLQEADAELRLCLSLFPLAGTVLRSTRHYSLIGCETRRDGKYAEEGGARRIAPAARAFAPRKDSAQDAPRYHSLCGRCR